MQDSYDDRLHKQCDNVTTAFSKTRTKVTRNDIGISK